ncbi:MAG: branched-chain amino acid ABC transporter permease [Nitrospirae bacterium]|nr:branched-chain amino acid ABC transporter permease [Nitrospirota bacterium]
MKSTRWLTLAAVAALFVAVRWIESTDSSYLIQILTVSAIYAIMATSYNLVNGVTGQFSLQPNAFAAIGAYATAILTLSPEEKAMSYAIEPIVSPLAHLSIPFLPALLLAGLLSAGVAFLLSFPVFRVRGDYLAIVTLGFGEIIRIFATNWISITNGPLGLKGLPAKTTLTTTFVWLAVTLFILTGLIRSSTGRAWRAIREDESAARAVGVNVFRFKMLAFVISAFFQAIGGGLLAHLLTTVDPKLFTFFFTFNLLIIIVIGGLGSMTGATVASFLFAFGSEFLRFVEEPHLLAGHELPGIPGLRMVIFSLLLILIMLFFRRGLFGPVEFSWRMFARKTKAV